MPASVLLQHENSNEVALNFATTTPCGQWIALSHIFKSRHNDSSALALE